MQHESDDGDIGGVALADPGPVERRPVCKKRRDKRPAPPYQARTEGENNDNDTGGPSADRQPADRLPGIRRRGKMPLSPHVGFESNDNDAGGPSVASTGPAGRHSGNKRREQMPGQPAPPNIAASPNPGPFYRRPGSVRTVPRPYYKPTPPASSYAEMPSWLPPLTAPPGMAMMPMEPRPLHATEMRVPDRAVDNLRTELHAMQAEISTSRLRNSQAEEAGARAELVQRIRLEEERRIKDRMEAMREAQDEAKREIEQARIAAEAAARERLEGERQAENERNRAIAEMKAEAARQERERIRTEEKEMEVRAREHAHMLAVIEWNTTAKLKREESEKEEKKMQLDKERALFELETRIKVMAELKEQEEAVAAARSRERRIEELEAMQRKLLEAEMMNKVTRAELMVELKQKQQATAAEESRKRWTEELEAREREVLKAEIMKTCTEELTAREKAVFEAEMASKYARQGELEDRERTCIEMETKFRIAADLAPLLVASSSSDDSQSDDTSSSGSYSVHDKFRPGNREDNLNSHRTVDSPGHSTETSSTNTRSTASLLTNSHSSQGQESDPHSHSHETSQGKSSSPSMTEADAPGTRDVPADIDAVYHLANTNDVTVQIDLDVFEDIEDELEEFSRLSRIGSFAYAESYFDLHLRTHFLDNPFLFVQYADMLLEKGDYRSLMSLDDSSVFVRRESQEPEELDDGLEQLELNWKLIRGNALCHTQHKLGTVRGVVENPFRSVRNISHVGSTEASNSLPGK